MAKKTVCDICNEEIHRRHRGPGGGGSTEGSGSVSIEQPLRRRVARILLGPLLRMDVWKGRAHRAWGRYDLCEGCKIGVEEEVAERVRGDQ